MHKTSVVEIGQIFEENVSQVKLGLEEQREAAESRKQKAVVGPHSQEWFF